MVTDWCRRGQALDLKDDYLSTNKQGKENEAPDANTIAADKADGNWPEIEIRVASKRSGKGPDPEMSLMDTKPSAAQTEGP